MPPQDLQDASRMLQGWDRGSASDKGLGFRGERITPAVDAVAVEPFCPLLRLERNIVAGPDVARGAIVRWAIPGRDFVTPVARFLVVSARPACHSR